MLELFSFDRLPVMKVGGHMDGRRPVRLLRPLKLDTDVVGNIGTLVLAFGMPPPCLQNTEFNQTDSTIPRPSIVDPAPSIATDQQEPSR